MARTLRSILAKAVRAVDDQAAVNADSDYWWLLPQITPWPPPQAPPPVEPQNPETESDPAQGLPSGLPLAIRGGQRELRTRPGRGRPTIRDKKKGLDS